MYDDDRLLACALGLEDDPELLEAAAADAALAARLDGDARRRGADRRAGLGRRPEPDESYTDLSGERWSGLKEFFEPPAAATAPRRRRRWWQVAAPVAAVLVVALVVGIVAVQNGGRMGADQRLRRRGGRPLERRRRRRVARRRRDQERRARIRPPRVAPATLTERFADQLDRFAVVVLARAREVSGAVQKFAVLRIFKGEAPEDGRARGRRRAGRPRPPAPAHARSHVAARGRRAMCPLRRSRRGRSPSRRCP